ncbi:type II secretion system F family protein [Steroidobacter sp. S1-65]|uniref:Type II secretion system F family protein n=1 Tax=Steroidobacter gossypii TaxID=2805490 RepID=A0ABS1WYL7_9GAMM|nr:type II secretion system F family protein [Steroidobacter gossypii]MBM0106073.1 type II secretion system F family protein [Steroidobacter gossypii]
MSNGIWLFALLVFFTVVLLLQGTVVPVFSDSRKMNKRIQARLQRLAEATGGLEFNSLLREKYLRDLSSFERTLEALPGMGRLAHILEQAGRQTPAYRLVLFSFGLSVGVAIAAWIMSRWWPVAIAGAVVGLALPYFQVLRARAKRFMRFEEQMPDAIDMIQRALKAGHPFGQCLKLVAEDMEEPISREFETTFADLSYGNDPRRALFGLLQRVPSVSVTALITAVMVQRETGGNLAENLAKISSVIRGRFRFQRRVKTLSAEGRLSGWILSMTPLVLFGVLWLLYPDYVGRLTGHPMGSTLIGGAVVLGTIGVLWIRQLVRIEV